MCVLEVHNFGQRHELTCWRSKRQLPQSSRTVLVEDLLHSDGDLFVAFGEPARDIAFKGVSDLAGGTFHSETECPAAGRQLDQQLRFPIWKVVLDTTGTGKTGKLLLQFVCCGL